MTSVIRGLTSVVGLPVTSALLIKATLRFIAPVYGNFLASQHVLKFSGVAIGTGMALSYFLTPKPTLPGASGTFHWTHAWALSLAALLIGTDPFIMHALFPMSQTWGPTTGPILTMTPTFLAIFGIGYALAGGMDLMAIVRVSFAFFFTGTSVIELFMGAIETYAREKWNIRTCTFEGLILPYLFKNFGGAPPVVAAATPNAPVVVKEKKEDKNSGKAGAAAAGGKATTAKTVTTLRPAALGWKNYAHAVMLALTIATVFWTEQGGVRQCLVGVYPSANATSHYKVLDRADSNTGYVTVFEDPTQFGGVRMMRCDHSVLGGVFTGHHNNSVYGSFYFLEFVRYIERKKEVERPRALQIGLGIGVTAKTLSTHNVAIDIVELDPKVYEFAKKYFDCPPGDNHYIGDGRHFLDFEADDETYDWVLHDVFTGGVVPGSLFSVEALTSVKRVLKKDGVLALNFVGQLNGTGTEAVVNTIKTVFPHLQAYHEKPPAGYPPERISNVVFFASSAPIKFRPPTQQDFKEAPTGVMYSRMLENFSSYRLKDEEVAGMIPTELPEGVNRTVIRDGSNPLAGMQVGNAVIHWEIMRELFPQEMWVEV
ncbi:hypothetical protein HK097_004823 [Rhizophlyctis rosea]|uniref:PABS domain-containing protein n=1 Tax=Rhizophlyctis rosea TaxID=64517 RepID=A0AAD5SFT3_9FUNG|nr:hypothetical protein HK097_004823 [Rhizophlyctis rosea]